ncbi:MAG: ribosomal RNA small subunit methyltransferase A, partial [Bacilli bacterium]
MNNKDIATKSKTIEILDKYHLKAKKSFGQNFLIDNNIVRNIVNKAMITKDTCVIEIGPGIGSLTQELSRQAKKVVCFEIDKRLEIVLNDTLGQYQNIDIIFQDFLQVDLNEIINTYFKDEEDIVVVANLPYYITTAIL